MQILNTGMKITFKQYLTNLGGEINTLEKERTGEILSFIISDDNQTFLTILVSENNKTHYAILKPEMILKQIPLNIDTIASEIF